MIRAQSSGELLNVQEATALIEMSTGEFLLCNGEIGEVLHHLGVGASLRNGASLSFWLRQVISQARQGSFVLERAQKDRKRRQPGRILV
jgi:hypothetical protein